MTLLIVELHEGRPCTASAEALAAAHLLGAPVTAVALGDDTAPATAALGRLPVAAVVGLEHARLAVYSPDVTVAALAALVADLAPSHVVAAHTYQARDYMPRLAARLGRPLLTDCAAIVMVDGRPTFGRPIFQGKAAADVVFDGPAPHFVTTQIGTFRTDRLPTVDKPAPVRTVTAALTEADCRQSVEPPFREAKYDVDLSAAQRIVAAGRGIKEEGQLAIVRHLAAALGAEIAASRPLCDAGWLPMDRQVGSSGQTVAPQLYLALGISGAIQHIVGMRGSRTIVAINKDADAPIFEIADYGIVGDLFEIVPALISALEAR